MLFLDIEKCYSEMFAMKSKKFHINIIELEFDSLKLLSISQSFAPKKLSWVFR